MRLQFTLDLGERANIGQGTIVNTRHDEHTFPIKSVFTGKINKR